MDLFKQLDTFYSRMEYNPVSANAISLWYALMHIANKTRWLEYFTVANKTLELKSGLEISSLQRARNELIQKKLLIYEKGSGKHVLAKYCLPILYEQVPAQVKNTPAHIEQVPEQVKSLPAHNEHVKNAPVHYEQVGEQVGEHIIKHKTENTKQKTINTSSSDAGAPTSMAKKSFDLDGIEYKSSKYLADKILEKNPHARVPRDDNELFKWCVHIDYLLRLDKKPLDELRQVLRFAVTDPFWSANILSTKSLRDKYDKLFAHMTRPKTAQFTNKDDSHLTGMERLRREREMGQRHEIKEVEIIYDERGDREPDGGNTGGLPFFLQRSDG